MRRRLRQITLAAVVPVTLVVVLLVPAVVVDAAVPVAAPKDLPTVISNITAWLVGLLVSLATLFLTIGFIRMLLAGGDPGEVAKGKDALKNAALGYAGAILAPVLVKILQSFVGG